MTQAVEKKQLKITHYHKFYRKFEHIFDIYTIKSTKKSPTVAIYRGNFCQKKFAGKELDTETGLYYYGARYLDPKASRWLSGDPAVGEYIPSAPVSEEARKRNGSLPGMGGVFNYVNLHVYHYAGNNPVKYVDPDGEVSNVVIRGSVVTAQITNIGIANAIDDHLQDAANIDWFSRIISGGNLLRASGLLVGKLNTVMALLGVAKNIISIYNTNITQRNIAMISGFMRENRNQIANDELTFNIKVSFEETTISNIYSFSGTRYVDVSESFRITGGVFSVRNKEGQIVINQRIDAATAAYLLSNSEQNNREYRETFVLANGAIIWGRVE